MILQVGAEVFGDLLRVERLALEMLLFHVLGGSRRFRV